MTDGVQVTLIAVTGVTVTLAVAVFVVSWLETAVIVAVVLTFTGGPVRTPLVSMEPMLAPHVTDVLNVPVPVTVAVHWLVCPDSTEVGVQATETAVMVELLLPPPPPQPQITRSAESETASAK